MVNVDTFPLLKLPYLPLANVIQQFDSIHERIHLATLSRRTAILVKSLRDIKVLGFKLTVWKHLNFSVIYLDHGGIRHQEWIYEQDPNILLFPFSVDYNHLQKLIDTMTFIFGLSGFEELIFDWHDDGTLKMFCLQNLLPNLETIKFDRNYSSKFYEQVLAAFPSIKNVSMRATPNNQFVKKKLEVLELDSQCLNVLGLVNCESLQIKPDFLTSTKINQYLKSWIHGRMPRLKHIRIQYAFPLRQDLILKGIENAEADRNRKMTFKSYSLNLGNPKTTVVQGGVDIKSENGVRATVTIQNEGNAFQSWNMNVWD